MAPFTLSSREQQQGSWLSSSLPDAVRATEPGSAPWQAIGLAMAMSKLFHDHDHLREDKTLLPTSEEVGAAALPRVHS